MVWAIFGLVGTDKKRAIPRHFARVEDCAILVEQRRFAARGEKPMEVARLTFSVDRGEYWGSDLVAEAVAECLPEDTGFTLTYNFAGGYIEKNKTARIALEPSYTLTIAGLNGPAISEIATQLARTFKQKEVLVETHFGAGLIVGLLDQQGKWRSI